MPAARDDPYGSVPDMSSVALVLIDLINDLEFEGGERMLSHLLRVAPRIAALKASKLDFAKLRRR